MGIGANLKRLRRDNQWTQGELASVSGVKLGHISDLENNKGDPKLSTIQKLLNALKCSPNALLSDVAETTLDGRVSMAIERVQTLPEEEKNTILDVIDKYCGAVSIQGMLAKDKSSLLGFSLIKGSTEPLAKAK